MVSCSGQLNYRASLEKKLVSTSLLIWLQGSILKRVLEQEDTEQSVLLSDDPPLAILITAVSNRHISMRNVCERECECARGCTWLQTHNYLKSNTLSTSCQPINHRQRRHRHVGKLKGSFLLKSCKWTRSPLPEKGVLYGEQMG